MFRIRPRLTDLNNLRVEPQSVQHADISQPRRESNGLIELLHDGNFPPLPTAMPNDEYVPILRKTAYREQQEKKFERSLEYVQIQCKILKYLDSQGAALTPRQAYKWTLNVAPGTQQPQPVQALRICYYMRSLGFDTFAVIVPSHDPENGVDDTMLRLFIANSGSEKRGQGYDHLYWVQRIATGEVISKPYQLQRSEKPQLSLDVGPAFNTDTMN